MQLKLRVVFLFSLVLVQHNSSGVTFTRHDATPRRNNARQKQGVYGALKHPSPAEGHMCKEKREKKIRFLVVPLNLKFIWDFPKCSKNKQDSMNYGKSTIYFFLFPPSDVFFFHACAYIANRINVSIISTETKFCIWGGNGRQWEKSVVHFCSALIWFLIPSREKMKCKPSSNLSPLFVCLFV